MTRQNVPASIDAVLGAGPPDNAAIFNCPVTMGLGFLISIVLSFSMQLIQGGVGPMARYGEP